jgi:protein Mpv17
MFSSAFVRQANGFAGNTTTQKLLVATPPTAMVLWSFCSSTERTVVRQSSSMLTSQLGPASHRLLRPTTTTTTINHTTLHSSSLSSSFMPSWHRRWLTTPATKEPVASSNATTTATTTNGGGGFVAWYEGHLEARPIPTKMVTGAILWGFGDVVGQIVPNLAAGKSLPDFDWPRLTRATVFGCFMHAPLAHVHYNFLEWMTVRAGITGLKIPIFKAFMEQFVYWSWFSNSLYHGAMGLMQGYSVAECYQRIADVLWDTQVAQWIFWIPIQLINFNYTPVRHQLNVVLVTSIIWTAFLSWCYPPIEEIAKEDDKSDEPVKS